MTDYGEELTQNIINGKYSALRPKRPVPATAAAPPAPNPMEQAIAAARLAVREEMRAQTLAAIDACMAARRPDAIGDAARAVSSGAMSVDQVRETLASEHWAGALAAAARGVRLS
jgi:hypothetical protein